MSSERKPGGPPVTGMMNSGTTDASMRTLIGETLKLLVFTIVCYAIYGNWNGNKVQDEWSLTQNVDGVDTTADLDLATLANNTAATLFRSKKGGDYLVWTFIDCFYFAMETVTTVGYGDIVPGNDTAKAITIFVCIIGVLVISQSVTTIANWFLEKNRLKELAKQKKMLEAAIEIAGAGEDEEAAGSEDGGKGDDKDPVLDRYFAGNPDQKEAFEKLPEAVRKASMPAFTELAKEEEESAASEVANFEEGGGPSPKQGRKASLTGKKVKRKNSVDEDASTVSSIVPLKEDGNGSASKTGEPVAVKIKMGTGQRIAAKLSTMGKTASVLGKCFIPLYVYIAACFLLGHIEGWSGLDCIYFSIITMTTVGFGDVTPFTQDGRLFAAFLLPAGLIALTIVVGLAASELPKIGNTGEKTITDLLRELKEVIDDDDDGTVTEEEYLIFCLKAEGKVDADTLDILRKQFQALDADGSGELDEDDVKQLTEAAQATAEHHAAEAAEHKGGSQRGHTSPTSRSSSTDTSVDHSATKLEM